MRLPKIIKRILDWFLLSKVERRHKLVGNPKLWRMKQDFQITFLKGQGLRRVDRLLDIGCGTLRGGIPIIDFLDSGKYCGVEIRAEVMREGRMELKEHGLESKEPRLLHLPTFKTDHVFGRFDVIWCFSTLFHMEDYIATDCFRFIAKHLDPDGVCYANVDLSGGEDGQWQGFPVVRRLLSFYRKLGADNGMKVEILGRLGELGHQSGVPGQDNQVMLRIELK